MKVILLSATHQHNQVMLKFYNPETRKLMLVNKPDYKTRCYLDPSTADQFSWQFDSVEEVTVHDVIRDEPRKIILARTTDPSIIRTVSEVSKVWEGSIKYYQNYLYDNKLICGKWYELGEDGGVMALNHTSEIDVSNISMSGVVEPEKFETQLKKWTKLLGENIPDISRVAIDIEVETDGKSLPDTQIAENRITAISLCGSGELKEVYALNRPEIERGEEITPKNYVTHWFDSEKEMLENVFTEMERYPVVLTYNGDQFDLPYLYNRAINLDVDYNPFRKLTKNVTLKHGIHLDLFGIFSNISLQNYAFNSKYSEKSLNAVASALLNETKVEYSGNIEDMKLNELVHYCFHDSYLTCKLTQYDNSIVMNLLIIIARLSNMPIDDISRLGINHWCKSMIFFNHRLSNKLIPTVGDFPDAPASTVADIKDKKYRGAMVLEPRKGVHFDVKVMDFASLYPSIIKTNNISYETIRCSHVECKSNVIPGTTHWVCKKNSGMISLLIGSLKELRVNHFKPLAKNGSSQEVRDINDCISQALKVFLNASYGILGFEKFELYFVATAESIAAVGRDIISKTMQEAKRSGMDIIYGDTDSLFMLKPTDEQIKSLIQFSLDTCGMDLEVDKSYRYLILSNRKKNYFGIKVNGDIDIKGMSGKKSHTPPYLKNLFIGITKQLQTVQIPEDLPAIETNIEDSIKDTIENFDNLKLEELAVRMFINKPPEEYKVIPPALQAAKMLNGDNVKKGDLIRYVKCIGERKYRPIELVKRTDINKEKYLVDFESTMSQITGPMGINLEYIMRGQTNLDMW